MAELTEQAQAARPTAPAAREPQGRDAEGDKVFVWPHLVRIELVAALVYLLLFTLMSIFVNAPLRNLANPEVTPNPAKAPWYFLGLQELLLHMHPALAGVIVPAAALIGLAMIPYFDTARRGTGIYFYSANGRRIAAFAFVYTVVWELALILIDEFLVIKGMPPSAHGIAPAVNTLLFQWIYGTPDPGSKDITPSGLIPFFTSVVIPVFFMLFIPWLLVKIVRRVWKADTREVMIALFTFFVASFVLLTLIGSAFRGHSMKLVWPWQVGVPEEPLQ